MVYTCQHCGSLLIWFHNTYICNHCYHFGRPPQPGYATQRPISDYSRQNFSAASGAYHQIPPANVRPGPSGPGILGSGPPGLGTPTGRGRGLGYVPPHDPAEPAYHTPSASLRNNPGNWEKFSDCDNGFNSNPRNIVIHRPPDGTHHGRHEGASCSISPSNLSVQHHQSSNQGSSPHQGDDSPSQAQHRHSEQPTNMTEGRVAGTIFDTSADNLNVKISSDINKNAPDVMTSDNKNSPDVVTLDNKDAPVSSTPHPLADGGVEEAMDVNVNEVSQGSPEGSQSKRKMDTVSSGQQAGSPSEESNKRIKEEANKGEKVFGEGKAYNKNQTKPDDYVPPKTRSSTCSEKQVTRQKDEEIAVHFHVVVSPEFKMDPNHDEVYIRFGLDHLGGFNSIGRKMNFRRFLPGSDAYKMMHLVVPISKYLFWAERRLQYKYVVQRKKKKVPTATLR